MIIWIDAQLSPVIAKWINLEFGFSAKSVRDLGLLEATDEKIFLAARKEMAIVMTKDADFLRLLEERGSPPKIIWLTCGNTSNRHLKTMLRKTLSKAIDFLDSRDDLVEISDRY